MIDDGLKKLTHDIINRDKWWDMLSQFIDVLRINIFIVDSEGGIILPPEKTKFGGQLLLEKSLGFDFPFHNQKFQEYFHLSGDYLENKARYNLRVYAIPVEYDRQTLAYVIVGPVINTRKESVQYYENEAKEYGVDYNALTNELNEIRVVSNLMLNSILNLLAEIIRDSVQEGIEKAVNKESGTSSDEIYSQEMKSMANEIYSTIRQDELLATLLDVAIKITETQSGSIMIVDDDGKSLTIKVSRGINSESFAGSKVDMEGTIAGMVAQEKKHHIIHGQQSSDNRLKDLLKRPEIRHALVMPLLQEDHVFGVLNLNTEKEEDKFNDSLENLQYLTRLLSSAI